MKLTAGMRGALPRGDFALPGGRYPIEDAGHARAALSEAAQHASPNERQTIDRKVAARYPAMGLKDALVRKLGGGL